MENSPEYKKTLDFIVNKYGINPEEPLVQIRVGRYNDIPNLFKELGFKVGAEIGVLRGDYTKFLCEAGFKMHAVDAWAFYHTYKDFRKQKQLDEFEQQTREKLAPYDCEIHKGWSTEIVNEFEDNSLDFVFIDGNHDFRHTTDDVDDWSKKVRPGGIVYGHDFKNYNNSNFMHVRDVLPAYCNAYKIKPLIELVSGGHIPCWMFVRPDTFDYNQ